MRHFNLLITTLVIAAVFFPTDGIQQNNQLNNKINKSDQLTNQKLKRFLGLGTVGNIISGLPSWGKVVLGLGALGAAYSYNPSGYASLILF